MCKLANNKRLSVFLTLVMITTLFAGMTISASADVTSLTISASDFTNDQYTVPTSCTDLTLSGSLSGKTIIVNSDVTINGGNMTRTDDVTTPGTPHTDLTIECQTAGVTLTLQNYYALNNSSSGSSTTPGGTVAPGSSLVRFTGTGNTLNIKGDVLLETTSYVSRAGIAVNSGSSLNITGTTSGADASRFYMYKYSQGCGIGSDANQANGEITISSGNIFIKGSKTGALIGNDAGSVSGLGNINISGGNINLVNKAQGAAIGGSRMSYGGNVYISGGNVSIVTDFSGSAIGAGAQKKNDTSVSNPNGNLYVTGGSLKTMIMDNAYSSWSVTDTSNEITVSTTGEKYVINNASIKSARSTYLYKLDTSDLNSSDYTVSVDGATFYSGGLHEYEYSDITRKLVSGTYTTIDNWAPVSVTDQDLYLYLSGTNHILGVNGTYYLLTYSNGSFSKTPLSAVYLNGSAASNGNGTSGNPYNSLTDAVNLATAAGVPVVVSGTVSVAENTTLSNSFVRANGFTGTMFNVANGKVLTLASGASIMGDASSVDVYLNNSTATDTYISLNTALSSPLVVQCANPVSGTTLIANATDYTSDTLMYVGNAYTINATYYDEYNLYAITLA